MRKFEKMIWVGENKGCSRAAKLARISDGLPPGEWIEDAVGFTTAVCEIHHQMVMVASWPSGTWASPSR